MSGNVPTAPTAVTLIVIDATHIDVRWTNGGYYQGWEPLWLCIERKPDGGSYAEVACIDYMPEMECLFRDGGLADGTKHYYRMRTKYTNNESPFDILYSTYSSEVSAISCLPLPTGLNLHAEDIHCWIYWNDESQNETGFELWYDAGSGFVLFHTTGPNAVSYDHTGLTKGAKYTYKIRAVNAITQSGFTNPVEVWTGDCPNAPSDLTGHATAKTTGVLDWQDNADNESGFRIYISTNGSDFTLHDTITTPNIETYNIVGLTQNTHYWFKVTAYNYSGGSDWSNTVNFWTFADIGQPTNVQLFPVSDTILDGTFEDNSDLEEDHRLELKIGAGAYSEVLTIAANVTHFRITSGVAAGETVYIKIRSKAGINYSAYSDEASTVMLTAPAAPGTPTVSEHKDVWMRLAWTSGDLTAWTVIMKSTNGADYAEAARVDPGVQNFKATGLVAGTHYWFKLAHRNGYGWGGYSAAVDHWTDATYEPTAFEKLMRRPKAEIVWRLKVNPSMVLAGWTLTSGVTYEQTIQERGIDIESVYENGAAYAEKTSIATVEATASTFWFDYFNRKLYIHTSGGTAPGNYLIIGSFRLYFTNRQVAGDETVFNGDYYLSFLKGENIPSISEEIQPYYEGNFTLSTATISLINGYINKQPFFDRLAEKYIWLNRKAVLDVGGKDFLDAEFEPVRTGIIGDWTINDAAFTLSLTDLREGLQCSIPKDQYTLTEFPNMNADLKDQYRPFGFGTITNAPAKCVDTVNRIFEFHNGRCKSVTQVTQNGTALTVNVDYWIDYHRGRITLSKTLAYQTSDIILVDFIGQVNSYDTAITNGAEIFKYIFNNFMGVDNSGLDLDSIYETKYSRTTALAAYFYKGTGNTGSDSVIKTIEHSIRAYSFQDGQGRIGLKVALTAAPTDIKYVASSQIFSISKSQNKESLYGRVHVHYNENPSTERYQWISKPLNVLNWTYGPQGDEAVAENLQQLDIYTYLPTEALANALGDEIVALLEKKYIDIETSGVLYPCKAGDLFYLNRDRYYDLAGTANNKLMRIISITKQASGRRVSVKAEEV